MFLLLPAYQFSHNFMRGTMRVISMLFVLVAFAEVGVIPWAQATDCPSPCKQAKADLQAIRNVVQREREFAHQLKQALTHALNKLDYANIRNAYLQATRTNMRSFAGSEGYKRLNGVERARWQKLHQLKARKDLLAVRQLIRNLKEASRRASRYERSLENLQKIVLDKADELAGQCQGKEVSAWRKGRQLVRLLKKARRWLCRQQRGLLRGYEYAWMEAGLSPLGSGTVEQVALHTRSRGLFGVVEDATWLFGPVNGDLWKKGSFGAQAADLHETLGQARDVLKARFGGTPPEKCDFPEIQPLPKRGKTCVKPSDSAAKAHPPRRIEVMARSAQECVGGVVRHTTLVLPGGNATNERIPPEKTIQQPKVEKPSKTRGEARAPKKSEAIKADGDLFKEMTEIKDMLDDIDEISRKLMDFSKEESAPKRSVSQEHKNAIPIEIPSIFGKRLDEIIPPEWTKENIREKTKKEEEKNDIGLVKAQKNVIELIAKDKYTGTPLPEAVIKLVEMPPELPSTTKKIPYEIAVQAIDAFLDLEQLKDLRTLNLEKEYPLEDALYLARDNLELASISALLAPKNNDLYEKQFFEDLFELLQEVPGVSALRARQVVEKVGHLIEQIRRDRYHQKAFGGIANKGGKVSVPLPVGLKAVRKVHNILHEPHTQKVVLLPDKTGKEAIHRIAEAGKVRELPVMKHPRSGKPVKPLIVDIPATPQAGKKLRKVVDEAAGGEAQIYDDPCLDKEEETFVAPDDPLYVGKGAWGQDFNNQWAIRRIGLTPDPKSAWAVRSASSKKRQVVVAIIDSGLDWQHPDIDQRKIWRNPREIPSNGKDDDGNGYVDDIIGWNFVDEDNKPWDQDGHGTFVAGIIGAATNNGYGIAGINPHVKLMILKSLGPFGRGYGSAAARAVLYAVDNGADIINLSLGAGTYTPLLHMAISRALKKGIIIVVAAGNQAKRTNGHFPAGLPGVLTVTATDRQDKRAPFSNWGTHVDIAAPGVDVLSLRARGTDLLAFMPSVEYKPGKGIVGPDRAFYRASGTSFAAPLVSGALSLILVQRPDITRAQAVRMIKQTARDVETPGIDNYTGYGLLDVAAALRADPKHFIEARINAVRVVRRKGKVLLQVSGNVGADKLKKAQLFLGVGDSPSRWKTIGHTIRTNVRNGVIANISPRFLTGASRWVLRLVVTHADGAQREARFSLRLR